MDHFQGRLFVLGALLDEGEVSALGEHAQGAHQIGVAVELQVADGGNQAAERDEQN